MIAVEISHCWLRSPPDQLLSLSLENTKEMRPTRGCVSHECSERAIYDGAVVPRWHRARALSPYPL